MNKNRIRQGILAGLLAIVCLLPISGWAGGTTQLPATAIVAPSEDSSAVDDAGSIYGATIPINRDRIKQVIYPSFGNPAILRCCDQLTVEFDPRDQNWNSPFPVFEEFKAFLRTSNGAYPVTKMLRVDSFTVGYSTHWPEYAQARKVKARIYLVKVTIPADVPFDLYDLIIRGKRQGGVLLEDSQPHAVSVVQGFKEDFTFVQMTDIHVWGPEAKYPGASTQDKNYRHAGYSEADGYGAAYYSKAIAQVNLTKPDFAVFTGDYDFSQKWLYQQNYAEFPAYRNTIFGGCIYEPYFEMDWFYQETMKLDVPVFITLGNHDSYARYNLFNTKLEEDYMDSWRNLFGPQYFSFDYGPDFHLLSANSNDWSSSQRNLHWAIPNVTLAPGKWQGQLLGGGDLFKAGWSQAREDVIQLSALTGQLAWLRDDLAAHQSARMRVVAIHHDPWRDNGSGMMFDNASMFGIGFGGEGAGRLALIKLLRQFRVALVVSGHEHTDGYGTIPWSAGGGEVKFVNTTCTEFNDAPNMLNPEFDEMWSWPGYRLVRIVGEQVLNFAFAIAPDSKGKALPYSFPFYANTVIGGPTNYANLTTPALETAWSTRPGDVQAVSCTIINHLTGAPIFPDGPWSGDLQNAFLEFPMPLLTGHFYYTLTGGAFGEIYDSGLHRIYQVTTDVLHAPDAQNPSAVQVSLQPSVFPDLIVPTCAKFLINGGAKSTSNPLVNLTNDAVDLGGSGLLDMRIANDNSLFVGSVWQRYQPSACWMLALQPGVRSVFIQFRDAAMPGNLSPIYQSAINFIP